MREITISMFEDFPEYFTGIITVYIPGGPHEENTDYYKLYLKNGKYHREDGPAKIWNDGFKEWWLDHVCYGDNRILVESNNLIILESKIGEYNLMWDTVLDKNSIKNIPRIPGLILQ